MNLLNNLKDVCLKVAQNKKLLVLVICIFVAIVSLSAVRCSYVNSGDYKAKQHAIETAANSNQKTNQEIKLTDFQKSIYSSYDKNTSDFVALLSNNAWVDKNNNGQALSFTDNSCTYASRSSDSETKSMVVCKIVESNPTNESTYVNSTKIDQTVTTYSVCVLSDDNVFYSMQLKKYSSSATTNNSSSNSSSLSNSKTSSAVPVDNVEITLTTDMFNNDTVYVRGYSATSLKVGELPETTLVLIDYKEDDLELCLQDYCSVVYPTATKAESNGAIEVDESKGTVTLHFTLDNNNSSKEIKVTYDKVLQSFQVTK